MRPAPPIIARLPLVARSAVRQRAAVFRAITPAGLQLFGSDPARDRSYEAGFARMMTAAAFLTRLRCLVGLTGPVTAGARESSAAGDDRGGQHERE